MKLMNCILILLVPCLLVGQTTDSTKIIRDKFNTYDELRAKQETAKIDQLTYLDSSFNFRVKVPNWLKLRETGSAYAWGGTLPAVQEIENAILIKIWDKTDFATLKDFKRYIIEDISFGQTAKWSEKHQFMGKKELPAYKNIGQTYKVYWLIGKLMYHCEYVILETKTAYLWIDFTATQETFDTNISKFEEFLNGFQVIN